MARWMNTDATQKVACPKCNQPAGSGCRTPGGRKCDEPHIERLLELRDSPGFTMDDYTIKLSSVDEIMKEILQ